MVKTKKESGITLIALIITIIVLLILAGVSISTIVGENGVIGRSASATTVTLHSEVYERIALEAADYTASKVTGDYEGSLISYFSEKGYIKKEVNDAEEMAKAGSISGISQIRGLTQAGSEKIGYDINIEKLLGRKTTLGNGSNFKNVYRLEETDDNEEKSREKLSSGYKYNSSPEDTNEITYEVSYYDSNGNRKVLGEVADEAARKDTTPGER